MGAGVQESNDSEPIVLLPNVAPPIKETQQSKSFSLLVRPALLRISSLSRTLPLLTVSSSPQSVRPGPRLLVSLGQSFLIPPSPSLTRRDLVPRCTESSFLLFLCPGVPFHSKALRWPWASASAPGRPCCCLSPPLQSFLRNLSDP